MMLLSVLSAALACHSGATPSARNVRVLVRSDEGRALSGIPIEIDGLATTKTGADGSARISLSPKGGARARIAVSCGTDQQPLAPRYVARELAGGTGPLELAYVCRPAQRKLSVVVRAPGGQGLLLRADGEPVGRLGDDGTLHALLSRAPDSELRLAIDTGDLPLTPHKPSRIVRVPDRDELVVFEQVLSRRPLARRSARLDRLRPEPRDERTNSAPERCISCEERSPACIDGALSR